ncbi:MAG: domain S-box protein [Sphingobacteriales bacterium]|nr:domain S-box protein [Sphingobacteriales bacterium]
MQEKNTYKLLEWASYGILILIAITILLLHFSKLDVSTIKFVLTFFLIAATILFLILRKAVINTIKIGKVRFKSAEYKFGKIYESDLIGIVVSSFNGAIIDANDTFLKMLGYTQEDLASNSIRWDKMTPPEFKEISEQVIYQLQSTGVSTPFEKQYFRKDGSRIWVLLGAARLTNEQQKGDAVTYMIDISEKKIAENQASILQSIIEQQQEEFKSVFMNAPAFITIRRGSELRYDFVNKMVMDFSGRDDYFGKTLQEIQPNILSSEDDQMIREVYETGIPKRDVRHRITYKSEAGNSKEMYLDYYLSPVYDCNNKVDGITTFGFEVTDLVMANQEMELSRNRFSFVTDNMLHKTLIINSQDKIDYLNKAWLEYLDVTPKQSQHIDWRGFVHPDDMDEMLKNWSQAIETGSQFSMEIRYKSANGTYRTHLTQANTLNDANGNMIMRIAISTDIHDQKEQVKQLEESEIYFRTLADETPFMVWKSDAEGRCVYVNKKWIEITGVSFEESLGFGFNKVMVVDKANVREEWLAAIDSRTSYQTKFKLRISNGELRWVIAQANPYYLQDAFAGFIGSIVDITDQEVASQALRELSEKKDEFLSIASHELKTPLTSVKAFIQLIEKSINPEEKTFKFATKASEHLSRLERLISDLLDVSKINAGKLSYNEAAFDFHEMVEELIKSVQHSTPKHTLILEHSDQFQYLGDKYRIEQVIYNLLSNAIKYSPEADTIIIKSTLYNNNVFFSVTDFGIGIDSEDIGRIIDRYYRVDETSMRFQGLGLGLFISNEILKRHKGQLWIESIKGEGSTFYFQLPLKHIF